MMLKIAFSSDFIRIAALLNYQFYPNLFLTFVLIQAFHCFAKMSEGRD